MSNSLDTAAAAFWPPFSSPQGGDAATAGQVCPRRRGGQHIELRTKRRAAAGLAILLWALSGCTAEPGRDPDATDTATSTADTVLSAVPGHLLYGRTTGADAQAFYLRSGGDEQRLTHAGQYCCVARVSPDHRRILTMRANPGSPIRGGTISLDGTGFEPLPAVDPTLNLVPLAWSPDGGRIAFEGWDDADPSRTGVYVAAVDGSDLVRVTDRPGLQHDVPLDFSPDGTQLVIYRAVGVDPDPYVGGSLWVVGVDGSNAHPVAEAPAQPDVGADWSPDGSRILFANERTARTGSLWTVRPDGSGLTEVFSDEEGRFAISPIWSPDGSQIFFALNPTNDQFAHPNNLLVVIDADGSGLRVIDDSSGFKGPADWWF